MTQIPQDLAERFAANHRRNNNLVHPAGRTRAHELVPVRPFALAPGDRVRFHDSRRWWTVQAVSPLHVALTRRAAFTSEPLYTVIAWDEGRRGPHDSWGFEAITREDCESVVAALDRGEISLSERRAIYLDVAAIWAAVPR